MAMVDRINRMRDFLSIKASLVISLFAAAVLFVNFLVYESRAIDIVWTGQCSVIAKDDTPYTECVVGEKKITEKIGVAKLYKILAEHKTLTCSVDANDNLSNCQTK